MANVKLYFAKLFLNFLIFALCAECILPFVSSATSNNEQLSETDSALLGQIVFVVFSQSNSYHVRRAQLFKQEFLQQVSSFSHEKPAVYLLPHDEWPDIGAWTALSLIPVLFAAHADKKAVFFCNEETRINLRLLVKHLNDYDFSKELFLGRGLRDKDPTIIHHYAFHTDPSSFAFPDFVAGFLLSFPLIESLSKRLVENRFKTDFSIDSQHELAMFVWDEGRGIRLQEVNFLCTVTGDTSCATSYPIKFPNCGPPINEDDLYVAVKTCQKYHSERVSIVKSTWKKDAKFLEFYSDVDDADIPTVHLGINNTEQGHCAKTLAILKRMRSTQDISTKNWFLITDDDTLISIPRLRRLLSCYNPAEAVALGERYGYGVAAGGGYDYITGGGGMVFSHTTIQILIDSDICSCPKDDSPDDMILGLCLKRLGIPITHSPLFHQARPADYSEGYLGHQTPISFHKHWMVDPYAVYNEWLTNENQFEHEDEIHEEL